MALETLDLNQETSTPSGRKRSGTVLRHWTTNVVAFKGKATATRSEAMDWGLAAGRKLRLVASHLKFLSR
jgi:hypothetical protein